jgi:DNA-binding NarL/FixJ family response regulator
VDEHPLVRELLREVIQREPDLMVCGEADDRNQALETAAIAKPHLAIVDLTLKNSTGLELIKDMRHRFPKVLTLVLSQHDETRHEERAVRAGARGFIRKQEATTQIMLAIRQVLGGEIYSSGRSAARAPSRPASSARAISSIPVDLLANRELQVFELIGAGRSTRQIAMALEIDVSTVETYRARVKKKLNLKDALDLLQHAIRWHIARAHN